MRTPRWSARSARSALRPTGRSLGHRPSTRLLAALAVTVIPVALGGCAAGQRAQTANEFSVVDGASANVGSMGVRNAGITAPTDPAGFTKGASVTLSMTVINNGNSPDSLLSVSSPAAARAKITAPTPTVASTGSSASATATGISVPANGAVPVGPGAGAAKVTLAGLTSGLVPGQLISVTMNFQAAGQITLQLPVKLVPGQTGGQTVNVAPPTDAGA
jgi:periplasmic copper chaperone A